MWHSLLNLFFFTWDYLVSILGINKLSLILFSVIVPILICLILFLYNWKKRRETGITVKQIFKESFFNSKAIITGGIYFLVLIFLLTWGITYEIYKDHEALKNRISILHKERNNYKNELENLKKKPQVEPTKKENIQNNIRKWLDNFQTTVQNQPNDLSYFRYMLTMRNGTGIIISRPKNKDTYLWIEAIIIPTQKGMELFNKLSVQQRKELRNEIKIAIAQRDIANTSQYTTEDILQLIHLEKYITITDLTENKLIGTINYTDSTVVLIQGIIDKYTVYKKPRE